MGAKENRFVANTYAYMHSTPVQACLERLARRGFRDFEVMMYPGHLWPAETDAAARHALRRSLRESGFGIVTLNMPNLDLNVAAATSEMRAYTLGVLQSVVELAADLEAGGVVIGPGKPNGLFPEPDERLLSRFYAALDALQPRARTLGVPLVVENMPFAFLPQIDPLLEAIDRYGWDGLTLLYDVANGYFAGEDIPSALHRIGSRLGLVHVSDTGRDQYRHGPIGSGSVPFSQVPPALEAIGYRGPVVLEIISPDPDEAMENAAQELAAMGWKSSVESESAA